MESSLTAVTKHVERNVISVTAENILGGIHVCMYVCVVCYTCVPC